MFLLEVLEGDYSQSPHTRAHTHTDALAHVPTRCTKEGVMFTTTQKKKNRKKTAVRGGLSVVLCCVQNTHLTAIFLPA